MDSRMALMPFLDQRKPICEVGATHEPSPPHPVPTAIELGACCSKHDFFDPPLKMIRPIQRQLGPGRFALGPHGDSTPQEHALELSNYLLDRKLTVKQIQQLV